MEGSRLSDEAFVARFNQVGATALAREIGCNVRSVQARRKNLQRLGHFLENPIGAGGKLKAPGSGPHRIEWTITNGQVIVGSDVHVWPSQDTPAMRAFVKFASDSITRGVILNGDVFDGARISRHSQIMWEKSPTVLEELEATQEWLNNLVQKTPRGVKMAWPWGNHDQRWESSLSARAPEYAGVKGVHLKDHHSDRLEPCWEVWINDAVVIKHRGRGSGENAVFNNVIKSGKTHVTGHLHNAHVRPFNDLNPRTRYGVDCGCLADPWGPQFRAYSENTYRNHRSGFAVLTFKDGELLQPELCLTWDEKRVEFRGELIRV